jgi:subtilisin family serine protease
MIAFIKEAFLSVSQCFHLSSCPVMWLRQQILRLNMSRDRNSHMDATGAEVDMYVVDSGIEITHQKVILSLA